MQNQFLQVHKQIYRSGFLDAEESESLFHPNRQEAKKQQKKERKALFWKKKQERQLNKKGWTLEENLAYKNFLLRNKELFQKSLKDRKAIKIHVLMSDFIGTRTSTQCRSHHQKMLKYNGDLGQIVAYLDSLGVQHSKMIEANSQTRPSSPQMMNDKKMLQINQIYQPPLSLWQSLVETWEKQINFIA